MEAHMKRSHSCRILIVCDTEFEVVTQDMRRSINFVTSRIRQRQGPMTKPDRLRIAKDYKCNIIINVRGFR
jgi:hypothetical protein